MPEYTSLFLRALAVTITIETAILISFFFWRRRNDLSPGLFTRLFFAGVVASCITLPIVWFIFPAIINDRTTFLIVAELFAFVAEVPLIRSIVKTTWFEAIAASLLANGASFIIGFLIGLS